MNAIRNFTVSRLQMKNGSTRTQMEKLSSLIVDFFNYRVLKYI